MKFTKTVKIILVVGSVAIGVVTAILIYQHFFAPQELPELQDPIDVLPPLSQNFEEALAQFDSPETLVAYLNRDFVLKETAEDRERNNFYSPEEFFQTRSGAKQDFAIFMTDIFDRKGYDTSIVQYQYRDEDRILRSATTVFVLKDNVRRYIFFQNGDLMLSGHIENFPDFIVQEEERLNIEIIRDTIRIFSPEMTRFIR